MIRPELQLLQPELQPLQPELQPLQPEPQPLQPNISTINKASRRYDPDMTSEWIVADITFDYSTVPQPPVDQVSEIQGKAASGEHSDNSQSSVERMVHQTRTTLPSLIDDRRGSTV